MYIIKGSKILSGTKNFIYPLSCIQHFKCEKNKLISFQPRVVTGTTMLQHGGTFVFLAPLNLWLSLLLSFLGYHFKVNSNPCEIGTKSTNTSVF
jgi:hypothetical protein